MIKNREGRPIKVEKNSMAPEEHAANARVHASILDLYDNARLAQPTKDNMPCLLYTSPSPRDKRQSRMPSSA